MSNDVRIELAKTWFVLSQVLMILSGFMFASSGIFYNSAEFNIKEARIGLLSYISFSNDFIKTAMIINNTEMRAIYLNYSQDTLSNVINTSISNPIILGMQSANMWLFLFVFGMIIVIFSVIFFFIGKCQLKKIANE